MNHIPVVPLDENLFRAEAIAAARCQLGSPVRSLGVRGWVFTAFFLALFACGLAFICTTRYAHKESVLGQVTPIDGALRITSLRSGVAEQVLVQEGQSVRAGQELIAISSGPTLQYGDSLAAGLKISQQTQAAALEVQTAARLEQLRSQRDEISSRRQGIQTDLLKLDDARALQQARIHIQEQMVVAAHALGEKGMMPAITVRAREDDLIVSRQSLAGLDRESAQQRSLATQLAAQNERVSAEMKLAQSDAAGLTAQLKEKRLTSEASYADHLISPSAGVVTALQAHQGAPVTPNQTLAIIVPNGRATISNGLEVELWAPSRAIGLVKPGAKVRIMYDAFPFQGFGVGLGVVRDISQAPVMPSELPIPVETKEQLFRIRVSLDHAGLSAYGRVWPLSPGMRLSADLVLEERSLLDWLLDPLLAARKRAG